MKTKITIAIPFSMIFFAEAAFAQANTSLSNLSNPTSVSQSLIPSSSGSKDLGSSSKAWRDAYCTGSIYLNGNKFIDNPGVNNNFFGYTGNTTNNGANNTAVGHGALHSNVQGGNNTAAGYQSMHSNLDGSDNSAYGYQSLYSNTYGEFNCAFGEEALNGNVNGLYNTAIGYQALYSTDFNEKNTASGYRALYFNKTDGNTADGYLSLFDNTTGYGNTAQGINSLFSNSSGKFNAAIGDSAGFTSNSGSQNTFLGYSANCSSGGLSNATAIGARAKVTASNNFVLGNSSVIGWGFGVAPSTRAILVGTSSSNGNGAYLTIGGAWTNTSARWKKEDFQKQDDNSILDKINQLEVTKWKYKGTVNEYHYGPMADDFHRLFGVGDDSSTSDLDKTGVLFLGMQALSKENEKVNDENSDLQNEINELQIQIDQLQSLIGNQVSKLSSDGVALQTETILGQNIPNPFEHTTLIPFRIPGDCHDASIAIVETATGKIIHLIPVSCTETELSFDAGSLASGNYSYSLYVDGKLVETKQMVLTK